MNDRDIFYDTAKLSRPEQEIVLRKAHSIKPFNSSLPNASHHRSGIGTVADSAGKPCTTFSSGSSRVRTRSAKVGPLKTRHPVGHLSAQVDHELNLEG